MATVSEDPDWLPPAKAIEAAQHNANTTKNIFLIIFSPYRFSV